MFYFITGNSQLPTLYFIPHTSEINPLNSLNFIKSLKWENLSARCLNCWSTYVQFYNPKICVGHLIKAFIFLHVHTVSLQIWSTLNFPPYLQSY